MCVCVCVCAGARVSMHGEWVKYWLHLKCYISLIELASIKKWRYRGIQNKETRSIFICQGRHCSSWEVYLCIYQLYTRCNEHFSMWGSLLESIHVHYNSTKNREVYQGRPVPDLHALIHLHAFVLLRGSRCLRNGNSQSETKGIPLKASGLKAKTSDRRGQTVHLEI